jgi:hypothetical protein
MRNLKRGTQIAYVPLHAEGSLTHPDVQFGFVTSGPTISGAYFCRYWMSKYEPAELRTKANSELTARENLVEFNSRTATKIQETLDWYCRAINCEIGG